MSKPTEFPPRLNETVTVTGTVRTVETLFPEGHYRVTVDSFGTEAYTIDQIHEAFAKHASPDDWGVQSFYETGLVAALRGEYDEAGS